MTTASVAAPAMPPVLNATGSSNSKMPTPNIPPMTAPKAPITTSTGTCPGVSFRSLDRDSHYEGDDGSHDDPNTDTDPVLH